MSRAVQVSPSSIAQIVRILSSSNRRELSQLSRKKVCLSLTGFNGFPSKGYSYQPCSIQAFQIFLDLFSLSSAYLQTMSNSSPNPFPAASSCTIRCTMHSDWISRWSPIWVAAWSPDGHRARQGRPGTAIAVGSRRCWKRTLQANIIRIIV